MAVNNDDAVNMTPTPEVAETPAAPEKAPKPSGNIIDRIKHFLQEVMVELKKTNWPTRNDWVKSTVVVMITIFIVAIYLFAVDQVAGQIMKRLLTGGS